MLSTLLLMSLAHAGPLWERVNDARDDAAALSADPWSRVAMERLVGELVSAAALGVVPDGAAERARSMGFTLERPAEDLLVLAPTAPSGAGFYAIRVGGGADALLLQAPHAWYDRGTGAIACALFEAGYGRALFLNTTHRYRRGASDAAEALPEADLAHLGDTLFQAATLGAAWALEDPLVVQIHGFGDSHGAWAAVISDGDAVQRADFLDDALRSLQGALGDLGTVASGEDVPALAGTQNKQGRALSGIAAFLHVELSKGVRSELRSDAVLLEQFGEALTVAGY